MLNILKKVPIIEIVLLILLNAIVLWSGMLELLLFAFGVDSCDKQEFVWTSVSIFVCAWISLFICLYSMYINIFNLSLNHGFLGKIYYLKNNKIARYKFYILLLILLPFLFLGCGSLSGIIVMLLFNIPFVMQIISLFAYWQYESSVKKHCYKGINFLNFVLIFIVLFFSFILCGLMFEIFDLKYLLFNIVFNLIIILMTFPLLIVPKAVTIVAKLKQKMSYVLSIWVVLFCVSIYACKSDWVMFYMIYISVLLGVTLVLFEPILKLKAKNSKLRREIEKEFENVNND